MHRHHELRPDEVAIRPARVKSWLDPTYQFKLSAELQDKLTARTKGERGLFLTLTYNRRDYENQRRLYQAASQQRHVRRFIEALSNYLGESLTGRWICKMEFQKGGWLHWHIIILGLKRIEHADLQRIWSRGHTFVQRMTSDRIRYFCKYLGKPGQLPNWLYLERIGTVKIIRTSPGFWSTNDAEHTERSDDELYGVSDPYDDRYTEPPSDDALSDRYDDRRFSRVAHCGPTIGQVLGNTDAVCNCVDHQGRWSKLTVSIGAILSRALSTARERVTCSAGWFIVPRSIAKSAEADALESIAPGAAADRQVRRLHLTEIRNPPWASHAFVDRGIQAVFDMLYRPSPTA